MPLEKEDKVTDEESPLKGPDFAKGGGLLPAIAQDATTGEVLMVAYMNEESFLKTLSTGEVHYWSRSRRQLWHKGGTSGHVQKVVELRLDCDGDAILIKIEQLGGAACHTGHRSCFHYSWKDGDFIEEGDKVFDPVEVYGR
jgi:phosphoribosyl-AMP cyclohydrolase